MEIPQRLNNCFPGPPSPCSAFLPSLDGQRANAPKSGQACHRPGKDRGQEVQVWGAVPFTDHVSPWRGLSLYL